MSEQFHPSSTGSPELLPPRRLSVPLPDEIMHDRNVIQARVMQKMLNLDDSARLDVTPDSMRRMEEWGAIYQGIFRDLFEDEHDTHFRDVALAGDIDEVVRLLEAARQKQSPSH